MGSRHHRMLLVMSEPVAPACFDDQRCRLIRILPWIRAQTTLLTMLSVFNAIPCPQAEFNLLHVRTSRSCRFLVAPTFKLSGPIFVRLVLFLWALQCLVLFCSCVPC